METIRAKLDKLPPEVRKLIIGAEVEAKTKNHFFIGIEHLAEPLLSHPEIGKLLRSSGDFPKLRKILQTLSYPKLKQPSQPLEITKGLRELLDALSVYTNPTPRDIFTELLNRTNIFTLSLKLSGYNLDELRSQSASPSSKKFKIPPTLSKVARNLNELALQGKLSPVIGREKEISRVIQVLLRKTKNNPVLIGEAGVGKTAIVEGLAQRIVRGEVPPQLRDAVILELNTASIVAGTKYRGEFEERLNRIIQEASSDPNIILFIDEIHTIVGAGDSGGGLTAANILKPAIARGELKLIGATTVDEFYRFINKDPALERRFEAILVEEPSYEEALEILRGVAPKYEEHHKVKYRPEALEAAVKLSIRYITDRHLPDKAIDLIDEAAAYVRLEHPTEELPEVTEEDIAKVVSARTGIPVGQLRKDERERIANLESELRKYIVGQDEAIEKVAKVIKISRAGLTTHKRPYGVFLFLGPTGVGKTYFAKILAKILFDSEERLFRIDMSEFKERHEVAKLLGAPPGYVGYEQEGLLTKALKTHPYCIILLDEIEKAHPEVFDIFLQVFDEGKLKDAKGRNLSFTDTVIIMTSNIGSELIFEMLKKAGGDPEALPMEVLKKAIQQEILKFLRPELLNRIDEVIVFKPLSKEAVRDIVRMQIKEIADKLKDQGVELEVTDEAVDLIISEGYSLEFGARNIRRTLQRLLVSPLAQRILDGEIQPGDKVKVVVDNGQLSFERVSSEPSDSNLGTLPG